MLNNITPISELPAELEDGAKVAWQVNPGPYVEQEAIGFDMRRAATLLRIAGLGGNSQRLLGRPK